MSFLDGGTPMNLACRVTTTGRYGLLIGGLAGFGSLPYTLSYVIAPRATDIGAADRDRERRGLEVLE